MFLKVENILRFPASIMDKGLSVWMGTGLFNINEHVHTDNSSHFNNSRKALACLILLDITKINMDSSTISL